MWIACFFLDTLSWVPWGRAAGSWGAHLGILGQKMNRITVGKAGRDIIGEGREAGEMAMTKKDKKEKRQWAGLPLLKLDETDCRGGWNGKISMVCVWIIILNKTVSDNSLKSIFTDARKFGSSCMASNHDQTSTDLLRRSLDNLPWPNPHSRFREDILPNNIPCSSAEKKAGEADGPKAGYILGGAWWQRVCRGRGGRGRGEAADRGQCRGDDEVGWPDKEHHTVQQQQEKQQ